MAVDGASAQERWQRLAAAVRRRRTGLGFKQDELAEHGGPSVASVRNIEQGARNSYSARTLGLLERALEWAPGTVDRVLAGTATEDEIDGRTMPPKARPETWSGWAPIPLSSIASAAASLLGMLGNVSEGDRTPGVDEAERHIRRGLALLLAEVEKRGATSAAGPEA